MHTKSVFLSQRSMPGANETKRIIQEKQESSNIEESIQKFIVVFFLSVTAIRVK